MRSLLAAVVFLTRLPLSIGFDAEDVRRSVPWFPLVGAFLGVLAAGICSELGRWGVPPMLAGLMVVCFQAWATGAIHFDGLADLADGFGAPGDRAEVLRVMRDPRIGSFGALALVLDVGVKVVTIGTISQSRSPAPVLIAVPAIARWTAVALGAWLPYAASEGVGKVIVGRGDLRGLGIATALSVSIAVALLGSRGVVMLLLAGLTTLVMGSSAKRRIGGVTGDVFGASIELTEAILFSFAVLMAE